MTSCLTGQRGEEKVPSPLGFRNVRESRSEPGGPGQEAQAGHHAHKQGDDDQVAHDVPGGQLGDTQGRQGPEGLDHVGPLVAPGDGHGGAAILDAHSRAGRHHDGTLDSPLAAAGGNEEVHHTGCQEGQHGEGDVVGDVHEELGDHARQGHALGIGGHHHAHDTGIEGELQQHTGGAAGSVGDGVHIAAQVTVEQDAQEQEDHVHDVQAQGEAVLNKVIDDVHKAAHQGDSPQNLGVLHLVGGGLDLIGALGLVLQQGGVDAHGVVLVGVHGIVHEGHGKQNHAHHDQVHGVEHGVGDGGLIQNLAEFLARHQVQGDGAGQARVPDDEAGVGGGDQQGIVHGGDPAHHFLGQQGAGDQAEAPVQPAADGGDEGGDHDGLHIVVAQAGGGPQGLFAGLGGGHGGAEHQHQGHLHREAQQTPEALGVAPGVEHLQRAHLCGAHGADENDDAQDDGKQEGIRQPSVDHANAAVGEFLEHRLTLL